MTLDNFEFHGIHKRNLRTHAFSNLATRKEGPVTMLVEYALFAASHGYILATHMNEHMLLNNVMQRSYE